MRKISLLLITMIIAINVFSQYDWDTLPIAPYAGDNKIWELQENPSDDFNYAFEETGSKTDFGNGKWYNFYHNDWDGPGTTYWQYDHVSVDGEDLVIRASRNPSTEKMDVEGINAACITGNYRVQHPVFVETAISVADIALASDVWLLSADDKQEIDIIECYGGAYNDNSYFANFIHLSHHSFIRDPFTDYQPRDENSWWRHPKISSSIGKYCWNKGNRRYIIVGVNWIAPNHFEYYVDGKLARVLYKNAFASYKGGKWYYTYPEKDLESGNPTFGHIVISGYQSVISNGTTSDYDFEKLVETSNLSEASVIDPGSFQEGADMNKEMDIIINVESQDWHVLAGRTPDDEHLSSEEHNSMKVGWIRVYKPVDGIPSNGSEGGYTDGYMYEKVYPEDPTSINDPKEYKNTIYPNPSSGLLYIQTDSDINKQIIIYSTSGVKVFSQSITNSIDLSFLKEGLYFIKIGDLKPQTLVIK